MRQNITRRGFMISTSALAVAACAPSEIDYSYLDSTARDVKDRLFINYPEAKSAAEQAAGYIVFPSITKAGLIVGGMTGDGTLFSKSNIIGHYNVKAASWGLQAGIQSFSMILYFMTPEAMATFRESRGVEFGTDVEYTLPKYGSLSIGASSATFNKPVYALIFNQEGIMVGASLKGAIYTQI